MASRRTRINRARRVIHDATCVDDPAAAAEVVDAIGCPDLMGAKEVAAEFETTVPNLRKAAGVPEPVAEVSASRLWDAEEVRAAAKARKRRRIGQGGLAPHAEAKKRKG